jgi:hypothetical protein
VELESVATVLLASFQFAFINVYLPKDVCYQFAVFFMGTGRLFLPRRMWHFLPARNALLAKL